MPAARTAEMRQKIAMMLRMQYKMSPAGAFYGTKEEKYMYVLYATSRAEGDMN
jgi:hypothetical protein